MLALQPVSDAGETQGSEGLGTLPGWEGDLVLPGESVCNLGDECQAPQGMAGVLCLQGVNELSGAVSALVTSLQGALL